MKRDVLGFAILGAGMISKFHARAIREIPGTRLVAVCDLERSRAETMAAEFGCQAFDSLDAVLARSDVDILVIATPSGTHMEVAVAAARAGKHVLCEKPLDVTLERVDAMIQAHREAGTRLGGIFQVRYTRALQPIRDALRTGRFGTLTYAGVYVPWWRPDDYYSASLWHGTQKLDGGGALMNQAIHMIDLMCDIMPPIESVVACMSSVGHPGIETEDAATAALQFRGGAVGVIYGSTSSWPGQAKRLEISGTEGTAIFVDDHLTLFDFRSHRQEDRAALELGEIGSSNTNAQGAANPAAMTHALHAECFKDFVQSLRDGKNFTIDGESARKPIAVIRAIYDSAATGRRIVL